MSLQRMKKAPMIMVGMSHPPAQLPLPPINHGRKKSSAKQFHWLWIPMIPSKVSWNEYMPWKVFHATNNSWNMITNYWIPIWQYQIIILRKARLFNCDWDNKSIKRKTYQWSDKTDVIRVLMDWRTQNCILSLMYYNQTPLSTCRISCI